ncbi:MAG: hypothetical protein GY908_13570 [Flavobacteriales bacterium]|nr:hypothetical protein [Flavobacteriales bacterium]
MSIIIDQNTTAKDLFYDVYKNDTDNFAENFANLIIEYEDMPALRSVIHEAWMMATIYDLSFDAFKQSMMDSMNQETIFSGQFDF